MTKQKKAYTEVKDLLLEIAIGIVSVALMYCIGWYLRMKMELSLPLTIVYALLIPACVQGSLFRPLIAMKISKGKTDKEQTETIAFFILPAVLVQFSLKFYLGVSWFWSITAALIVLLVFKLLAGLKKWAGSKVMEAGPTWAFGNLPPLDLKSSEQFIGRAAPSRRHGSSMPQIYCETLAVYINKRRFALDDRMDVEALALAGFDEGGSVARVQARALPDQSLLVSKHCVAQSFGGEFTVVTLMNTKNPNSATADTTAFLFFSKLDTERPLGRVKLERIVIVVAGGPDMLDHVTKNFIQLASEMFGKPLSGSRGQRLWRAGENFLVCEQEKWKALKRTTFTWTSEELAIRGGG